QLRARVVLLHADADRPQLRDHALGALPLAARRALDPAQLGEGSAQVAALELADARLQRPDRHGRIRAPACAAVWRAWRWGSAPRRRAAATKPQNSGAGRSGRDLNSG